MLRHTVSISFVQSAVQKLPDDVLIRVLTRAEIPRGLLQVPAARVSAKSFALLWLAVAHELDDEFFGLDSRRMKVGSFALLCRAILNSGTVGRALKDCLKGFSLFLDDIEGQLSLAYGIASIRIINRIQPVADRRFANETLLVMIHGLMCWLAGQRVQLLRAGFEHPQPLHSNEYKVIFSQVLEFGARSTEIEFDARVLSLPIVQDDKTLKRFLSLAPQTVFLKYKDEDSWTARLRKRLRQGERVSWPNLEEVSAEFKLTPSTLRRRLEGEGTTYQAVKDGLRRDIAIHLLGHTSVSINEIAEVLGFQDKSAFYRAFKRWTGSKPGSYRLRE